MQHKHLLLVTRCILIIILITIYPIHGLTQSNTTVFSVGKAKIDITPQEPTLMDGYGGREGDFQGIHDNLYSRALAISDGNTQVVILSVELIDISFYLWEKITKGIQDETRIPQENILLCATNTHSGPLLTPPYLNRVQEKLISAVKQAVDNIQPVRVGAGKGICKMSINRRARSASGGLVIGRNPYKPVDWEVGVIRIDDMNGYPVAILTNWGCHGTSLGPTNYMISGDWPGYVAKMVENKFSNLCIGPVLVGAGGDVNPFFQGYTFDDGRDRGIITGHTLGKEVIRIAKKIKTYPNGSIQVNQKRIMLSGKKVTDEKNFQLYGTDSFVPDLDNQLNLIVLKLGPVLLAGVSGQVFNEIGTKFKEISPFKFSFMINHCNGSLGYIPSDNEFPEGGYEVLKSRTMPGAEKLIIESLQEMIEKF